MKIIKIETTRLIIRNLASTDALDISTYRSFSEVALFQSWDQYTLQQAQELITQMENAAPEIEGQWYQFAIELKQTGELIGDIGFLNTDELKRSWVGFTLTPKYWHQGYASEAVSAVLEYYFKIGLSEFWASTDPQNNSSKKLLEKLGFILIESHHDDFIFHKKINNATYI